MANSSPAAGTGHAGHTEPFSAAFPRLLERHLRHLTEDSGISPVMIAARGPWSVTRPEDLRGYSFLGEQYENVPGIFFPYFTVDGRQVSGCYRPDRPRVRGGKPAKYEHPFGVPLVVDCPPPCRPHIDDPAVDLWITEGVKKADALASHGFCAISLPGVWGFKQTNAKGGVALAADLDYIAWNGRRVFLCFDSDAAEKPAVHQALARLLEHVRRKKADVRVVTLPPTPDGAKQGVDDFLRAAGPRALRALAAAATREAPVPRSTVTLADATPRIERPLTLLPDGTVIAVTWLDVRREVKSERMKDGSIVALNPARVRVTREPHALVMRAADGGREAAPAALLYGAGGGRPWGELERVAHVALEYAPPPVSCWSRAGVLAFPGAPGKAGGPRTLLERLTAALEHFLDFRGADVPAGDRAELVALWIMHTYFTAAFPVTSYLLAGGLKGCGKTQLLTIVARLSCLGRLIQAAATSASLRVLAAAGATLCFDDLEHVSERSFDPDKRAMLLASNRRGVTHPLMEQTPQGWKPREYHLYCPKAFSSITGFDDVLASRAISIPLVRTDDPEKARRDPAADAAWPEPPGALVDALWTLAVRALPAVAALPCPEPGDIFGRPLEPWRPLLTLAALVERDGGAGVVARVTGCLRAAEAERTSGEDQAPELLLLRGLLRRVPAGAAVEVTTAELADLVAAETYRAGGEAYEPSADDRRRAGMTMGRLRAGSGVHLHRARAWRVNGDTVRRLARAYGIAASA